MGKGHMIGVPADMEEEACGCIEPIGAKIGAEGLPEYDIMKRCTYKDM